jgi:UDP-N-acetylmuramate dehydrogenase
MEVVGEKGLLPDAPMSEHTSFRAGGKADLLVIPASREQLTGVLEILFDAEIEAYIMGNGSNILVRDGGYRGVIVKVGPGLSKIEVSGNRIYAESGALLKHIAAAALENGLTGFEFAAGIPGSLGGALYMNAGAYEGEMKDVVDAVEVIDLDSREEFELRNKDMRFAYRRSRLMDQPLVALAAVLRLTAGDPVFIQEKMEDFANRRRSKQPINYPSGGSFFKRPTGHFAGKLIQDAGLMGRRVGGASVSTLHAGFIINDQGATASDILKLMEEVQEAVYKNSGIRLEPEIRIIGEE